MLGLVVGDNPTRIWGFSSRARAERIFERLGLEVRASAADVPAGEGVICLNADYVFEPDFIKMLMQRESLLLVDDEELVSVVAAVVPSGRAAAAAARINGGAASDGEGLPPETPLSELGPLYHKALRKRSSRSVYSLRRQGARRIEWLLYKGAYKGVTDFMTKYAWPIPAYWLTKFCQVTGISPNMVTTLSLIFVVLATWLFWTGDYGLGLAAAWSMCILDTVDGKLARVTMRSSKWGEAYDHGIDLIHPPFWYYAWAMGLAASAAGEAGIDITLHLWVIIGGYVLGRAAEGLFMLIAGGMEMWIWRPLDSFVRLFVARRNPNLVLMSVAFLLGEPAGGLVAVSVWTLMSLAYQLARILGALTLKGRGRGLVSWLAAG